MCLEENEVQMFYITFKKAVHFNMTYNFTADIVFSAAVMGNIITGGKDKYSKTN